MVQVDDDVNLQVFQNFQAAYVGLEHGINNNQQWYLRSYYMIGSWQLVFYEIELTKT